MSKTFRWLLAINMTVVLIWAAVRTYNTYREANALTAESQKTANAFARTGVITQSEAERHMMILRHLDQSHDISDSDLDWGINLVQTSPSRKYGGAFARCNVLFEWRGVRNWTPSQKEKMFQTSVSLLHDKDNSVSCIAMQVIAGLKESRSMPALLPMLDSPRSEVRKQAQQLLTRMGYKSPAAPKS